MPDDYAQTAQTISPDIVTGLTEPAITEVMYDEIQKSGRKFTMNKKETYNTSDRNDARQRKIKRIYLVTATTAALAFTMAMPAFAANDPLATINALSDFVFSAIKAIGAILLGFGIVQIGLALKGHDASQRAQGFMTFFGGVVIYFAKDILDMILK